MHTTIANLDALLSYCAGYLRPHRLWPAPRCARVRGRCALAMAFEPLEPRALLSMASLGAAADVGSTNALETARIAAAANGHYVVAWETGDGNGTLEFSLFDASGNVLVSDQVVGGTQTAPVVVQNSSGGTAMGVAVPFVPSNTHAFDVAMDAAGDFVIAWQGSGGIYAQQYQPDGSTSSGMLTVSTGAGTTTAPAVAMDTAGDFAVTWLQDQSVQVNVQYMTPKATHQYYDSSSGKVLTSVDSTFSQYTQAVSYTTGAVMARRYTAAGQAADPIQVSSAPPALGSGATKTFSTNESPSVAMDAAGDFVVGWEQSAYAPVKVTTTAGSHSSYVYTYTDYNNVQHNHTLASYTGSQFSYNMQLSGVNVLFQRYPAGATASATAAPVVMSTRKPAGGSTINGGSVAVAMDGAGDFALADTFSTVKTTVKTQHSGSYAYTASYFQSSSVVTARRYSHTGAALGAEATLASAPLTPVPQSSTPEPELANVAAAMNGTGDLMVAWNRSANDSSNNNTPLGIFALHYDPSGKAVEKTPTQLAQDDGTTAAMPALASGGSTTVDLAFTDGDVFAEQYHVSAATQLKFTVTPKTLTSGIAGTTTVAFEDSSGKIVTAENGTVTLTVATGPDKDPIFVAVANAGVATINSLLLTDAGTYTLQAAAGTMSVTSAKITLNPGTASQMLFLQQPSTALVNSAMSPPVSIELLDSFNNVATLDKSKVTLSLQNSATALTGNVSSVSKGIATFAALKTPVTGTFTLAAADSNPVVGNLTSNSFTVAPLQLKILKQPTTLSAGSANASTPLVVQVENAAGKPVSNTSTVTLSIATGPGSVTPFTAVTNTAGTAIFTNIILDTAGTYTLTASDDTMLPATSKSITVKNLAASQLGFLSVPSTAAAGGSAPGAVTVAVEDAFGNVVTTANTSVTLSVGGGTGTASGTLTATTVHGVATFNTALLASVGTYSLTATAVGLNAGQTQAAISLPKVPMIGANTLELDFGAVQAEGVTDHVWGPVSGERGQYYYGAGQYLYISNVGEVGSTLAYSISTSGDPWLSLEGPTGGTIGPGLPNDGRVAVVIDSRTMMAGTYTGAITISSPNAAPLAVIVKVTVLPDIWIAHFVGQFYQVPDPSNPPQPGDPTAANPATVTGSAQVQFNDVVEDNNWTGSNGQGTLLGYSTSFDFSPGGHVQSLSPSFGFSETPWFMFNAFGGAVHGEALTGFLGGVWASWPVFGEVTPQVGDYYVTGTFTFTRVNTPYYY